jgi:hypothetical protein
MSSGVPVFIMSTPRSGHTLLVRIGICVTEAAYKLEISKIIR